MFEVVKNMSKWDYDAYVASLLDMPLDELCARLRGKYPDGIKYGVNPLQAEAARRLEQMEARIRGETHHIPVGDYDTGVTPKATDTPLERAYKSGGVLWGKNET